MRNRFSESVDRDDDATPNIPLVMSGLKIAISSTEELNGEELKNIALARIWVFKRPRKLPVNQILNEKWLRSLHLQMFSEIWEWAGKYRIIDTNIGIEFWRINQEVINAVEDARSQIGTKQLSEVERDLIVIRFSHRLVAIHPFPNGNGEVVASYGRCTY